MRYVEKCLLCLISFSIMGLLTQCQSSLSHRQGIPGAPAGVPDGTDKIVRKAATMVREFSSAAGSRIISGILENSAGIVVIPAMKKIGLVAGARHGKGVLLRHEKGKWSLPVFVSMTGAGLGAKFGIARTGLILIFRNPGVVNRLQTDGNFSLTRDFTFAAGPMAGEQPTDADALVYRRAKGVFTGFSPGGGRISLESELTFAYYAEPAQDSSRGYYEDGRDLAADLLKPDRRLPTPNIPESAGELYRALMTSAP